MDRRVYPRYTVDLPVSFQGHEMDGEGRSLDLSPGGCRVESHASIEVGTYLRLSLHPQADAPMNVDLAAVRWVHGRQFGLEFLFMHPEEYERLLSFAPVSQAQPGPAL